MSYIKAVSRCCDRHPVMKYPLVNHPAKLGLIVLLSLYVLSYGVARSEVFHGVETYPQGKGEGRRDYIAKKGQDPGEGWQYSFFLPLIKLEEFLRNGLP
ncbi:hypothetical protein [Prochlorothrix hollandica]|uniref:hypothetical protein n=1 Tax=Prochlorothrix hollandica TaxID=1223 RepID=UPI00333ED8E6